MHNTYETEKLYSKLRFAVLSIADNYHMMYKEDMTPIDLRNVEAIINSGVGAWKIDEFNDKFYRLGK
jgi:hypothetical protein